MDICDRKPGSISSEDFERASTWDEKILLLACCGALAPSTHNSQPWLVSSDSDSLTVEPDRSRFVPLADPDGRQVCLSLGAFITNVEHVANAWGQKTYVHLQGSHLQDIKAVLRFDGGGTAETRSSIDLLKARRNNRHPFPGDLPDNLIRRFDPDVPSVKIVSSTTAKAHIAELVSRSFKGFISRADFRRELSGWVTSNSSDRADGMPACTHRVPTPLSRVFPYLVRFVNIAPLFSRRDRRLIEDSPAVVVLTVIEDQPAQWIEAGRLFERIALSLTSEGCAAAMHSAVIESPLERAALAEALDTDEKPVALFRVGRPASPAPPSPRRPARDFLVSRTIAT